MSSDDEHANGTDIKVVQIIPIEEINRSLEETMFILVASNDENELTRSGKLSLMLIE